MSKKVYVTGTLDLPKENRSLICMGMLTHAELSRAEKGCLKFEVIKSSEVEGRLLVDEVYTDMTAFEAHKERASKSPWAELGKDIVRALSIVEDV